MRQAEETYCDFIGLRIFGISYLYAFAYLLSPNIASERAEDYPNFRRRAENLAKAAKAFGVKVGTTYANLFEDLDTPDLTDGQKFMLSIADNALEEIVPDLINRANEAIENSGVTIAAESEAKRISERFQLVVPAENAKCLADILNAGWTAMRDANLWKDIPAVNQGSKRNRDKVLKELILKNIEVFEIEQNYAGGTMILKAERVASLLRQGDNPRTKDPLVIVPQPDLSELDQSGSASVDLRLGTWFVSLRQARMTHLAIETPAHLS